MRARLGQPLGRAAPVHEPGGLPPAPVMDSCDGCRTPPSPSPTDVPGQILCGEQCQNEGGGRPACDFQNNETTANRAFQQARHVAADRLNGGCRRGAKINNPDTITQENWSRTVIRSRVGRLSYTLRHGPGGAGMLGQRDAMKRLLVLLPSAYTLDGMLLASSAVREPARAAALSFAWGVVVIQTCIRQARTRSHVIQGRNTCYATQSRAVAPPGMGLAPRPVYSAHTRYRRPSMQKVTISLSV